MGVWESGKPGTSGTLLRPLLLHWHLHLDLRTCVTRAASTTNIFVLASFGPTDSYPIPSPFNPTATTTLSLLLPSLPFNALVSHLDSSYSILFLDHFSPTYHPPPLDHLSHQNGQHSSKDVVLEPLFKETQGHRRWLGQLVRWKSIRLLNPLD